MTSLFSPWWHHINSRLWNSSAFQQSPDSWHSPQYSFFLEMKPTGGLVACLKNSTTCDRQLITLALQPVELLKFNKQWNYSIIYSNYWHRISQRYWQHTLLLVSSIIEASGLSHVASCHKVYIWKSKFHSVWL